MDSDICILLLDQIGELEGLLFSAFFYIPSERAHCFCPADYPTERNTPTQKLDEKEQALCFAICPV